MLFKFKIVVLIILKLKIITIRSDEAYLTNYARYDLANSNKPCLIPSDIPWHTKYETLRKDASGDGTVKPGEYLQTYETLLIVCDRRYKLNPLSVGEFLCRKGNWNPALTTCSRACPPLTSITSTNVTCEYNGSQLENCDNPVEGTIAHVTCNTFYSENSIKQNPTRLCSEGKWNASIPQCRADCGQKRSIAVTNIAKGQITRSGDYPWHVGIYNNRQLICGGAIIERNIVLTVAHCVTDYTGAALPLKNFSVAAGKYYSAYDDKMDENNAQFSKILNMLVPEKYKSQMTSYDNDIAVLILSEPFTFSLVVKPVCIDLNQELLHLSLVSTDDSGIVTGWGYTEEGEKFSDVLRELVIPYIPYDICFQSSKKSFKRFITTDKFCGGYVNNAKGVCTGDSGGALVVENKATNRYFVMGLVSLVPSTHDWKCDTNRYSIYTNVKKHIEFIKNAVDNNSRCEKIEFSQNIDDVDDDEEKFMSAFNGQWTPSPGNCARTCPTLLSSVSRNITCEYNGQTLKNCENPIEGTTASLSCNPYYENSMLRGHSIFSCIGGRWNSSIPQCIPICGNRARTGEELASWHVGIYSNRKEYLCGGSIIINTKIILSAAQCFIDNDNRRESVENYLVAAGKLYREYDDYRDEAYVQYSKILEIHIPQDYKRKYNTYNIAILILHDSLLMSPFVQPMCLELNKRSPDFDISTFNYGFGEVSGWGSVKETRQLFDVLKNVKISYIPLQKCYWTVPTEFQKYVTFDKFCGEYTSNDTSLCEGDSGEGLIFYNVDVGRYYIKGIVIDSSSPDERQCKLSKYTVYTSIDRYLDFLNEKLANYL